MKYDIKTTVFPGGCIVNTHTPQLSEEERTKALNNLKKAAQKYAKSLINVKQNVCELGHNDK